MELRAARPDDAPRFQEIRRAAFAPVFASFRAILGDEIHAIANAREDEAQADLLASLFGDPRWELYAAEDGGQVVGFVSLRADAETSVGEIGLNAIDPPHAGKGAGTAMYALAAARLRALGMKVATVGTGGDESHAPARRAYQKAGFDRVLPAVWMYRKL